MADHSLPIDAPTCKVPEAIDLWGPDGGNTFRLQIIPGPKYSAIRLTTKVVLFSREDLLGLAHRILREYGPAA